MVSKKHSKHRAHKRGDRINEMALKWRKWDKNFSQSRDIRENRGSKQTRLGRKK